ncbi:MAG: glycosyltransferase family 2 protein [Ruminococcus sp.]|nr:glycosyltransferase family 2 protein [Ruminococcus sp.]
MVVQTAVLYLVIPCYNEQEVLLDSAKKLKDKMVSLMEEGKISYKSKIVFVNDGSKDKTWDIICELHKRDDLFSGIKLTRNRGHQNALLGGLMTVKDDCDVTISLDADLQDDINAIDEMLEKYYDGCDIVYGIRDNRKTDSRFKRATAQCYYKLLKIMGAEIKYNHADYRLMSKRALEGLEGFKEVNLFLRGIVPLIGYKSAEVYYKRGERLAGESKYPLRKMIALAFEGITSFSIKPIRFITFLGIFIFCVSIIMLIYFLIRHFTGATVQGWTSIAVSVWAIGGLQLFAIGIIGEYIGKVYLETKERPKFIIEEYLK